MLSVVIFAELLGDYTRLLLLNIENDVKRFELFTKQNIHLKMALLLQTHNIHHSQDLAIQKKKQIPPHILHLFGAESSKILTQLS